MGDLELIKERNARVESDKAWETSWTRRGFIAAATYITACLYMKFGLQIETAALHALVPTGGYLLSTLSLSWIKEVWKHKIYQSSFREKEP